MNLPDTVQILQMMSKKLGGEEHIPEAIKHAEKVSPELIQHVAVSSKQSISAEDSPFDQKTATLIFLAATLASGDERCVETQAKAALNLGTSKEELTAVVKIARHALSSKVIGTATPLLKILAEER
jgi:alkylhydroperoxidase/carboxymuconolactone decarboxylase family protein YurZ